MFCSIPRCKCKEDRCSVRKRLLLCNVHLEFSLLLSRSTSIIVCYQAQSNLKYALMLRLAPYHARMPVEPVKSHVIGVATI